MTIYVDKITTDFNNEHYPSRCDRQCVRCKEWKILMYFQRSHLAKTSRYVMQNKHTLNCCECLDSIKQYIIINEK